MRVAAVIAMIPVAVASVLIAAIRNAKTGARSVSSWLVLNIIIDEENEKWKMNGYIFLVIIKRHGLTRMENEWTRMSEWWAKHTGYNGI